MFHARDSCEAAACGQTELEFGFAIINLGFMHVRPEVPGQHGSRHPQNVSQRVGILLYDALHVHLLSDVQVYVIVELSRLSHGPYSCLFRLIKQVIPLAEGCMSRPELRRRTEKL